MKKEILWGVISLDPPGVLAYRMSSYGTQRLNVNRIVLPIGYEQGLGYAFSCCSAVARCCDMGSFEGGGA